MNEQQQELYEKLLKKVNEYCLGYAAEDVIAAIDDLVDTYESKVMTKGDIKTMKPPLEPLQALKELVKNLKGNDNTLSLYDLEKIVSIEKSLKEGEKNKKALEILKRNCLLTQYPDGSYELAFPNKIIPSDDDVELLKEVLL